MKAVYKLAAGLAVAGLATAAIAARPMPRKVSPDAEGVTALGSTATASHGFNYTTGFEATGAPGGYNTTGYIAHSPTGVFPAGCNSTTQNPPCFGHTAAGNASLITPTIATTFPAGGTQHLRLTHDPSTRTNITNFGLGVDARYPHSAHAAVPVRPTAPNTVSIDLSISNPNGMDYRVQPQSNNQGFLATSALFFYSGSIYVLDNLCGAAALAFVPTGAFWDTTGAYQNYTVAMNPCTNPTSVTYSYGGAPIYAGCTYAGTRLEQFLIFGDNYPGSEARVDNLVMSSYHDCGCLCGNGIIQNVCETCEPGVGGCNPGHTCGAVGTPEGCTCSRICTLDEPCTLENGANGPFYGPFDAQFGGIFIYEAPDGADAVSVELCGSTGADQRIFYWGSCTDPGDPGSANDDCCDPNDAACGSFGVGSDPSASCYNDVQSPNWESCTCHDNPLPDDNCYLLQIRPPSGAGQVHIEINKKAVCAQGHLGSCCDTNGADAGCTDNVLSGACSGADKLWTENGKCADVGCACIPDCTGADCGDDGCGGSCGDCSDNNACNGVETCVNRNCVAGTPLVCNDNNACNGFESCIPASGCVPGTPLKCNDGDFCNGTETCNPSSGCVPGTIPCPENTTCNEDADACDPNSIPTVSEWGIVVLALLLLVGAKTTFRRIRKA